MRVHAASCGGGKLAVQVIDELLECRMRLIHDDDFI